MEFAFLPPEVNSARIFSGAGVAPMLAAAAAWEGLSAELSAAAESFGSVTSGLASGWWSGPASVAMTVAAAPYVQWLSAAAGRARQAAGQASDAAAVFEAAQTATVHPGAVVANRGQMQALVTTNVLGQNTPAIAATEAVYEQMWVR